MDKKEKYHAEIEARLIKFGETLHEIKTNMEQRKENLPDIRIDATIRKHEEAKAKVKELKRSDESIWKKVKAELDNLVNDIDEDLRQALAYFG
jgi:ABC-type Fe3+-citrate transport system substrate-binding protein